MNKAQVEALKNKAHHNARKVLKALGVKGMDYGERVVGCCPIPHNDGKTPNDNHTAFSWLFDRGIWRCFSNNCQNEYGSDIIALIRSVKKFHGPDGFTDALSWLCELLEVDAEQVEEVSEGELQRMNDLIRRRSELRHHSVMEDSLMKHLKPCGYLLDRGFSAEAVVEFKANGSWHKPGTYGHNRLIIPIYDPIQDYLIGFTARTLLSPEEIEQQKIEGKRVVKWLHCRNFGQERQKSSELTDDDKIYSAHILFNLHRAKQHMGDKKTIILTEGPLDVMKLWDAGFYNAAAVLGTSLSKQQKELLHHVGAQRLVVCFDNDIAGEKAFKALSKLCGKYFEICKIELPTDCDPGDLDIEQLKELFQEYK